MVRIVIGLLMMAFLASACNTMDGLVTDVDHGVSKLQGDDHRR